MKKFTLFLFLNVFVLGLMAQPFLGVSWVGWHNEPSSDNPGYANTPYDKAEYTAIKAPDGWAYADITDAASFDATWGILGDSMAVANATNTDGGDLFDLGSGNTFGSAWKAVHDGANLYVLLKYWDVNGQANADSRSWEICTQPTSPDRHEPTFKAAQDSAENVKVAYENQAYARVIELGGGKALFKDGAVSEFAASVGNADGSLGGPDGAKYLRGGWGANDFGLTSLAVATHFWDVDADGTIRAIMVMPFDGALAYPADPANLEGDYIAVEPGDKISFEVKSNALTGEDAKVEYWWSSTQNNAYASNYYAGYLTLEGDGGGAADEPAILGVSWVGWHNEPSYEGVTGYADNPYDNPEVTVYKAPATWDYTTITDDAGFDATWDILGDSMAVANATNTDGGDIFDLGSGNTFGSAWKAVHDGANLYVLLKYWDVNSQANADSRSWEICTQPTSPVRHEATFQAAQDSAENVRISYENQAYARVVELGGGKALFKDGAVSEFAASIGLSAGSLGGPDGAKYLRGGWGANDHGLTSLAVQTHYWNVDAENTIRAILVMPFDGALAYPADMTNLEGDFIPLQEGDTIAFEVKSNALTGEDAKVEYWWSSDQNNAYASNFYVGHMTISSEQVVTSVRNNLLKNVNVYTYNNFLRIKGMQNVDVSIYSVNGTLVKSVQNVSGQLNISELPKGLYIVKLNDIPAGFKVIKE